jgi:photosystem II stability/assembly factor-like uncharacterized protein
MHRPDIEQALRASLQRHAQQAPTGELLAERIVTRAGSATGSRYRGLRTWGLPALASAAVAAVAVVIAVAVSGSGTHQAAPPAGVSRSVDVSPPAPGTSAPPVTHPVLTNPVGLTGFRAVDLTFVSETDGWALGTADCLSGVGRCSALVHTTDGRTWTAAGQQFTTPWNVGTDCTNACVRNIRFANARTGYVFGPSYLLMTTDGGRTWTQQSGGALFLETLNDNVIRVTGSGSGCPGPCDVRVETSAIGSAKWIPSALGPLSGVAFTLSRGGHDAYLLAMRNPAGGAPATSTLYRSTDDGRTWRAGGEPCPQSPGVEVDSYAVAGAPDGRVAVLCRTRFAEERTFLATSTDHGAHFTARSGTIPSGAFPLLTGDPDGAVLSAGDTLARSTDGGRSWQAVPGVRDAVAFVGFESPSYGRAISRDGRTIWTTTDAGLSWTPFRFP